MSMIDSDGGNDEIVRAIVTLARNLGLRVIAEGVETESQLRKLKVLECEAAQGFLFAEPMPYEKLKEFLAVEQEINLPDTRFDDVPALSLIQ